MKFRYPTNLIILAKVHTYSCTLCNNVLTPARSTESADWSDFDVEDKKMPIPGPIGSSLPLATISAGDTAFVLVATALVLLMTPALAFFYGGLVRGKNALNTMMMSFAALGVVGVTWAVAGYSLAFSPGNAFIGGLGYLGLHGVGVEEQGSIPHLLFMMFQGTFAIITAALISGAVVERMRFGPYLVFLSLWTLVVYAPICHWVWGGGWLAELGALDFAGGTVVHINAAAAAVVAALVIGPRRDWGRQALLPHNVPFVLLGAGLLWFGWIGFNGGSALAADGAAALAAVNTILAPAATLVMWMLLDRHRTGQATAVGVATGIVVGLVAITPAAGFVPPVAALLIGGIAALPSWFALQWRARTSLDDSLDVLAAHGIGGVVGALLTGVLARAAWGGTDGLLFGNPAQLGIQVVGIFAALSYSAVVTLGLLKLMSLVVTLRIDERAEGVGLDLSAHGEEAYAHGEGAILVLRESTEPTAISTQPLTTEGSTR